MESLTNKSSRWLRKTTAAGMIPLLLAQVSIALFCVPQSLTAGTEIRREMTMEELREFLSGEEQFTVLLSKGGAVRGNGVTILADSIHLGRIAKATDEKRHRRGTETSIAIGSVKEIRVEKMRGKLAAFGGRRSRNSRRLFFPNGSRSSRRVVRLGRDVAAANENVGRFGDWDCGGCFSRLLVGQTQGSRDYHHQDRRLTISPRMSSTAPGDPRQRDDHQQNIR